LHASARSARDGDVCGRRTGARWRRGPSSRRRRSHRRRRCRAPLSIAARSRQAPAPPRRAAPRRAAAPPGTAKLRIPLMLRRALPSVLLALAISVASGEAWARDAAPEDAPVVPLQLRHAGVTEHLDGQVPLDTWFRDHAGKPFQLRDAFDGKRPVIL